MKLNDLDEYQNRLISTQLKRRYCWSCSHLKGLENGVFQCQHPENVNIKGETVDGLVWKYLHSNNLGDYDSSDFGVGKYCSLYSMNTIDTAQQNLEKIKSLLTKLIKSGV